jgi:hypothetical protein
MTAAVKTANHLNSGVVPISALSAADRSEMWELYRRFYEGTGPALFDADLAQKESLVLLRDADGRIQGFSTIAIGTTDLDDRPIRYVFSGDTIIDRAHWGTQALAFCWLRFVGEIKRERPEVPLYWFLIVKGHRTFRYLPTFAHEFYPHWRNSTPSAMTALLNKLARERFGDAFDSANGLIRYPESRGHLVPAWAEVTEREAEREDVNFFLRRNAGYRRGDELVCLCELSANNLRPLARRLFDGTRAH